MIFHVCLSFPLLFFPLQGKQLQFPELRLHLHRPNSKLLKVQVGVEVSFPSFWQSGRQAELQKSRTAEPGAPEPENLFEYLNQNMLPRARARNPCQDRSPWFGVTRRGSPRFCSDSSVLFPICSDLRSLFSGKPPIGSDLL